MDTPVTPPVARGGQSRHLGGTEGINGDPADGRADEIDRRQVTGRSLPCLPPCAASLQERPVGAAVRRVVQDVAPAGGASAGGLRRRQRPALAWCDEVEQRIAGGGETELWTVGLPAIVCDIDTAPAAAGHGHIDAKPALPRTDKVHACDHSRCAVRGPVRAAVLRGPECGGGGAAALARKVADHHMTGVEHLKDAGKKLVIPDGREPGPPGASPVAGSNKLPVARGWRCAVANRRLTGEPAVTRIREVELGSEDRHGPRAPGSSPIRGGKEAGGAVGQRRDPAMLAIGKGEHHHSSACLHSSR